MKAGRPKTLNLTVKVRLDRDVLLENKYIPWSVAQNLMTYKLSLSYESEMMKKLCGYISQQKIRGVFRLVEKYGIPWLDVENPMTRNGSITLEVELNG